MPGAFAKATGQKVNPTMTVYSETLLNTSDESLRARELRDLMGYLKLPHAAMRDMGTATRLLGALYELVDGRTLTTFASVRVMAQRAMLPVATVRKQLRKLADRGWLQSLGRQKPHGRSMPPRRTVTYQLSDKAVAERNPYAAWPCWLGRWPRVTPASGMVYAVLLSRHCLIETMEDDEERCLDDRRAISCGKIVKATGLSKSTVWAAIRDLSGPVGPLIEPTQPDMTNWYELVVPACTRLHRSIIEVRNGIPNG